MNTPEEIADQLGAQTDHQAIYTTGPCGCVQHAASAMLRDLAADNQRLTAEVQTLTAKIARLRKPTRTIRAGDPGRRWDCS